MKTVSVIIFTLLFALAQFSLVHAASSMSVTEAALSASMNGLEPIGATDKFKADAGKVYCFTKVEGGKAGDSIRHVWYHGDKQVLDVALDVKGSPHRTFSNKTIYPGMTGKWRVDVVAGDGTVIKSMGFTAE